MWGMRRSRLKAPAVYPVAYYHCISRVVDRQFVLGELEKEQFVAFMREYEEFCGVRISWKYLRLRVRYFADGAVLGTRGFVNDVFVALRHRFGPKRADGARRMRGVESDGLYAMRDLRVRAVG